MPALPSWQAETFDAAYAMEATCHAPTLEQVRGRRAGGAPAPQLSRLGMSSARTCQRGADTASHRALSRLWDPSHRPAAHSARPPSCQVYREVYRVLKPGAVFMTYE